MLKLTLLSILQVCHRAGRTMPRDLLKREAEMTHGGRIGDGEFDSALGELLDKQLVSFVVDPLSNDRKYHLTEQGRIAAGA